MGKPMLAICERCTQKGIYRMSFNIMFFAKWKVLLKAKDKLGMKFF